MMQRPSRCRRPPGHATSRTQAPPLPRPAKATPQNNTKMPSKLALALALSPAAAFAPAPAKAAPRAAPLNAVGLYYSTTTGNTETDAGYLTAATGIEAVDIDSVDDETP